MVEITQPNQRLLLRLAQDLSIAARSYAVALAVLDSSREKASQAHRFQTAYRELAAANSQVQAVMAAMSLDWQMIPVARYLRTQVSILNDTLAYAQPDAVREYGPLDAAAAVQLAQWHRLLRAALNTLVQTVAGKTPETAAAPADAPKARPGGLTPQQRVGFGGFLEAFSAELLLVKGYASVARPPSPPVFSSIYDQADAAHMLAAESRQETLLEMTAQAVTMEVEWVDAAGEVIVRHTGRAEESARQVLHVVSGQMPEQSEHAAALFRAAHRAAQSALSIG